MFSEMFYNIGLLKETYLWYSHLLYSSYTEHRHNHLKLFKLVAFQQTKVNHLSLFFLFFWLPPLLLHINFICANFQTAPIV